MSICPRFILPLVQCQTPTHPRRISGINNESMETNVEIIADTCSLNFTFIQLRPDWKSAQEKFTQPHKQPRQFDLHLIYYSYKTEYRSPCCCPSSAPVAVYRYFSDRARARAPRNLSMATWTSGVKSAGNMMAMTTIKLWARICQKGIRFWRYRLRDDRTLQEDLQTEAHTLQTDWRSNQHLMSTTNVQLPVFHLPSPHTNHLVETTVNYCI